MTSEARPCNLCGEKINIRPLFQRYGYQIVRCETCSLVYLNEIPSIKELDELYSESFFKSSSKFGANQKSPSFINASKRVSRTLALPGVGTGSWLDVGCATGDYLVAAKAHVNQLNGNDVSAYALAEAHKRGLENLKQGDFVSIDYPAEAFDLISMWDLLEHVTDPGAALDKAYGHLKSGGYLVLSTGDVNSLISRLSGRFWHLMIPPLHISFFSKRTIKRYLESFGFEAIAITYPGKVVPLDFMIEKSVRMLSPTLSRKLTPSLNSLRLGRVQFPVNLFDIMTVTARKPLSSNAP